MEQQQQQQQNGASRSTTDFSASYGNGGETACESVLPGAVTDDLPLTMLNELIVMTPQKQWEFGEAYLTKKKSVGLAYVFWLILGAHYGYTGKWGLQVLFWFTAGGLGIWALVDLFRIPGMVKAFNLKMAGEKIKELVLVSL